MESALTLPLTPLNWLLAFAPVLVLISGILFFKWEAAKVGAVSWLISLALSYKFFGADFKIMALANAKGLNLSLYVLLIIWGAVLLYNIADGAGAIKVIGQTMTAVSNDRRLMVLLLAWCFTSMLQGLAGFGIPVAVVAPIMAVMGFSPVVAVATCLIGHSWSISFGSMGSSYNSIQLVTGIPGEIIGPWMAILFSVGIFATGFGVAHIYGGWEAVKKSVPQILSAGSAMSFVLWLMNKLGTAQLATLMAAGAGCLVLIIWAVLGKKQEAQVAVMGEGKGQGKAADKNNGAEDRNAKNNETPAVRINTVKSNGQNKSSNLTTPQTTNNQKSKMGFNLAFSPYYTLIIVSILTQIKAIKSALSPYFWGLNYPQTQTAYLYTVQAAKAYSKIVFFAHPAPILLLSAAVGFFVYKNLGLADFSSLKGAAKKTVTRCIPTSVGIGTMVMMALIMSDSGMTQIIAEGIAKVFGGFFPLVSPYIGVLGSFITGSNTNSNVMFGVLQTNTAKVIGKSAVLMAAAQSVGGSLGVSIAPSTIMTGAANVGLGGQENEIMKVTIKYCLINVALVGIFVYILSSFVTV